MVTHTSGVWELLCGLAEARYLDLAASASVKLDSGPEHAHPHMYARRPPTPRHLSHTKPHSLHYGETRENVLRLAR